MGWPIAGQSTSLYCSSQPAASAAPAASATTTHTRHLCGRLKRVLVQRVPRRQRLELRRGAQAGAAQARQRQRHAGGRGRQRGQLDCDLCKGGKRAGSIWLRAGVARLWPAPAALEAAAAAAPCRHTAARLVAGVVEARGAGGQGVGAGAAHRHAQVRRAQRGRQHALHVPAGDAKPPGTVGSRVGDGWQPGGQGGGTGSGRRRRMRPSLPPASLPSALLTHMLTHNPPLPPHHLRLSKTTRLVGQGRAWSLTSSGA